MRRLPPAFLALACIGREPLPPLPPPLRLVAIETPTGDPSRLGRIPELRVRFDRPVAEPDPDALLLVEGPLRDTLVADASDAVLSASSAARRVPAMIFRDARDPRVLVLRATTVLLPETPLVLLVTPRVRAADGVALEPPDAGPRARSFVLAVAPARRCGPLATLLLPDPLDAPRVQGRIYVHFDRPVRATGREALRLDDGAPVPARSGLECIEATGARCAWIEADRVLAPHRVHRVLPGALAVPSGAPAEIDPKGFVTGDRTAPAAVGFGPAPVCSSAEDPRPPFCVLPGDRWVELRATTTGDALLLAAARRPGATDGPSGLSRPGVTHALRIDGLAPGVTYSVTVWVLGADGVAQEVRALGELSMAAALPRVRISEVVARPRSTSAQEYVELVNDGDAPASLGGFALAQGSVRALLPEDAVIPAGGRLLLVGSAFDPRGVPRAGDPPVAPGTLRVVPRGYRGLRDGGADLALTDPLGRVLSFVPGSHPARAPRAGVGLVRADLSLRDEDPAAWSYDALGSATPGGPDRVR